MKTPRMRVVRRAARSSEIVSGIVAVAQTFALLERGQEFTAQTRKDYEPGHHDDRDRREPQARAVQQVQKNQW